VSRIPLNVVFENPTIQLLSSRVAALVNENAAGQSIDPREQHQRVIKAMVDKYSIGLNGPADGVLDDSGIAGKSIEPAVVLLTGSTGGLGSFLLAQLLESPVVQRVYALNRPSSTASIDQRQNSAFFDRGLPTDLLDSKKLVYIVADASEERCGLPSALYDEVRIAPHKTRTILIPIPTRFAIPSPSLYTMHGASTSTWLYPPLRTALGRRATW
jgi:hypothetical protein